MHGVRASPATMMSNYFICKMLLHFANAKAMIQGRKCALPDLLGVILGRLPDERAGIGEAAGEFRDAVSAEAEDVLGDQNLAIAIRRGPDADGRDADGGRDLARQRLAD